MRLTLRSMLGYVHGILSSADAEEIGSRIQQSEFAQQLFARVQNSTAVGAAPTAVPEVDLGLRDANTLAEYLDNVLPPEQVIEFEKRCLESDGLLAELVFVHQIAVQVLSEPAVVEESCRTRLHGLATVPRPVPAQLASTQQLPVLRPVEEVPRPWWQFVGLNHLTTPWMASLAVHAYLVILLGLWVLPIVTSERITLLATSSSDQAWLPEDPTARLDKPLPNAEVVVSALTADQTLFTPVAVSEPQLSRLPASLVEANMTTVNAKGRQSVASGEQKAGSQSASKESLALSGKPMREPLSASAGGVVAAQGVEGAVGGILKGVRGELEADDLLIVWLFDASLSLFDDRQQVAAQIEPFYREIDGRNHNQSHLLMNAAVAFGGKTAEMVEPIRFGLRMVEAVAKVPIDNTGLENVMTAVEQCVLKYRKRWKGTILIVIWTDESGDDTARLEDTIALCRREGVVVSVVGPSSVFGSERGFHSYVDRATGYHFLLPIKRGPDTSMPERLVLPYWHDSLLAPWSQPGGAQIAQDVPWYGGPYREGLLSGVGPYALTRLALATGGTFTLLDHVQTGGPFKFETMRRYLPDYGPVSEYLQSLKYHPLRQAILDVVQLTYREQAKLTLPKFSFISRRGPNYPFPVRNLYIEPSAFRGELQDAFADQTAHVSAGLAVLEQALARFGLGGMEQEYQREESARWRAWYDVTRGRLLAMSVRHLEYLLTCQAVMEQAAFLNSDTNNVVFYPSSRLKSNRSDVLNRVVEAERLLKRCIEQNPETPWAYLAQWELDRPLGLDVRQVVIPRPPPRAASPAGGGGGMPRLPNL